MSSLFFGFFLFYLAFVLVVIWLWIFTAQMVASAAFRKNRSFKSFFWLSFVLGPLLMALIVAVLPFDSGDPRNPQNVRATNPKLADIQSSASMNKATNRGFQLVIVGLVGAGILVSIIGSIAEGISTQASSSPSTSQGGESTVGMSGQAEKLVNALEDNCSDAPKPLTAVPAADEKAGHYLVTGDDGTSGAFYLLDKGNGTVGILADSSDDMSGEWVCGAYFTVSR